MMLLSRPGRYTGKFILSICKTDSEDLMKEDGVKRQNDVDYDPLSPALPVVC